MTLPALTVRGPRLIPLGFNAGANGNNIHANFRDLPFQPQRLFMMQGVDGASVRGDHAHATCAQIFIAGSGACSIRIDDLEQCQTVRLDRTDVALFVPALIWVTALDFTPGAVITVLSSEAFNPVGMIDSRTKLSALRTARAAG